MRLLVQHIAVPLSLLTALLYLFGQIHNDTYLKTWGLSDNFFPIPKEQSIISGFFRSLLLGAEALAKFEYVIVVFFALTVLAVLSMYRPVFEFFYEIATPTKYKLKTILKKHFVRNLWVDSFVEAVSTLYSAWAFTLILMLVIAVPCYLIEKNAHNQAVEEKKSILEGKISSPFLPPKCIVVIGNKTNVFDVYSGYLIRASNMYCAIYNKKDIQVFAVKDIHQITIHPKEFTAKP